MNKKWEKLNSSTADAVCDATMLNQGIKSWLQKIKIEKFIFLFFLLSIIYPLSSICQSNRWQQKVKYNMDIDVDAVTNRFTGKQKLEYANNSTDKLDKVFYHLYWNAFQPNSSMDVRSRELGKIVIGGKTDWDARVKDRIANLKEDEIGYQKIISLKMNGVPQPFNITKRYWK
jgi:hypothetical protein